MRALQRPAEGPPCLGDYQHGQHNWHDLSPGCRAEVRHRLGDMQRGLCAYCEANLEAEDAHIEHHHPRALRPQDTFRWSNLLASCNRSESCGCFKDSPRAPDYQVGDLIDPSSEDPDHFFVIRYSGHIEPRPGLAPRERARAEKTLAVLNLNLDRSRGGRSLCAERRRVLEFYKQRNPDFLAALEAFTREQQDALIAEELTAAASQPFGSIIRHYLRTSP